MSLCPICAAGNCGVHQQNHQPSPLVCIRKLRIAPLFSVRARMFPWTALCACGGAHGFTDQPAAMRWAQDHLQDGCRARW